MFQRPEWLLASRALSKRDKGGKNKNNNFTPYFCLRYTDLVISIKPDSQ